MSVENHSGTSGMADPLREMDIEGSSRSPSAAGGDVGPWRPAGKRQHVSDEEPRVERSRQRRGHPLRCDAHLPLITGARWFDADVRAACPSSERVRQVWKLTGDGGVLAIVKVESLLCSRRADGRRRLSFVERQRGEHPRA